MMKQKWRIDRGRLWNDLKMGVRPTLVWYPRFSVFVGPAEAGTPSDRRWSVRASLNIVSLGHSFVIRF